MEKPLFLGEVSKGTMGVNKENKIGLRGSHLGHIFLILIEIIEDILVIEDYRKGR